MTLLKRSEAAKRARICTRTLDTLVAQGRGPRLTRVGCKIFVTESHLNEWLASLAD